MLFPTHVWDGGVDAQQERQYEVAPDGRFLINTRSQENQTQIALVSNWDAMLKK